MGEEEINSKNQVDNEVSEIIKNLKRKKRKRTFIVSFITIIILAIIVFIKSPYFKLTTLDIKGVSELETEIITESLDELHDKNIYMIKNSDINNILDKNLYIKDVTISKKWPSSISITVVKEKPKFYVKVKNNYYLVNETSLVIDKVTEITDKNSVELIITNSEQINVGKYIYNDEIYKTILMKFYPFISENKETIKLDSLDINDIVNIKGKIGNIEVLFGDYYNVKEKFESIYSVVLSDTLNMKKGYINVNNPNQILIKK